MSVEFKHKPILDLTEFRRFSLQSVCVYVGVGVGKAFGKSLVLRLDKLLFLPTLVIYTIDWLALVCMCMWH